MPVHQFTSDITFSLEGNTIYASNIVFGSFTSSIPAHSHGAGCYEIHYISAGYGSLEIGTSPSSFANFTSSPHSVAKTPWVNTAGTQITDKTSYSLVPGTLYITGPNVEHTQIPALENPMQEYCIYLKLPRNFSSSPDSPILNRFTALPFWIGTDRTNISQLNLQTLFEALFAEYSAKRTGYETNAKLLLIQILIMIARSYEQTTEPSVKSSPTDLSTRKTLIIENYFLNNYRDASLPQLAERIGLGTRQTQRLLQEYYNKTFQQKKTESRMSAALLLLQESKKSIADVADALGYSSPEHFSGAFKAYYHQSPREYRKKLFT